MSNIECPVCGQEHDISEMCPICGFEVHVMLQPDNGELQKLEERRMAKAREIWEGIKERLSITAVKKPQAFLVTEQLTAYCIYEGENTFGSAKINRESQQHQKVIAGCCMLRPAHFAVLASPNEKRYEFAIREIGTEHTSVFVNNMNAPVLDGIPLKDNDNIIIKSEAGNANIKFRVNLN